MIKQGKKPIVIGIVLALLIMGSPSLFAQDLLLPRSGDYVFYHDTREGTNKLIGYLQPSEDTLFIREYDIGSTKDLVVAFKHSGFRKGFKVAEVKAVRGDVTQTTIDKLYSDFNFILQQRLGLNEDEFPSPIIRQYLPANRASTVFLDYQYWVPIVQLHKIWTDTETMGKFTIIKTGRMESVEDQSFFDFKGIPVDEKEIRYQISASKEAIVSHYGVNISIDSNWQYRRFDEKWPSYWISQMSGRDAILLIEPLDLASRQIANPYFFIKYFVLLGYENIRSDSVSIKEEAEYIEVSYLTYNQETKMSTLCISRLYDVKNDQYVVITLSAYEPLYKDNWSYFQRIWKSIEVAR